MPSPLPLLIYHTRNPVGPSIFTLPDLILFLFKSELTFVHYCNAVGNNRRADDDTIDVCTALSIGTGVEHRVAECEMDTGELLVLENIANQLSQARISTDSEFAYAIAVFIVLKSACSCCRANRRLL